MEIKLTTDAQLLSIYIGEADKWRGKPLYSAILETLKAEGMAGATVFRGVAGFGAHSRIHSAAILRLSEDLPLLIQVVDTQENISRAIELISPMVREGLITVEDVRVVRYTHRYLNPLPADLTVGEVMTREVVTLSPELPVADAWQKMVDTLIKAMPVVNEAGQVVGVVTDEDLLDRAGVQSRLAIAQRLEKSLLLDEVARLRQSPLTVADIMTHPAMVVRTHDTVGYAAQLMAKHGIKRLPVLDENQRIVGVLSRVDILRLVAQKESRNRENPPRGAARCVGDVMSSSIPLVRYDATLVKIVDALLEGGAHRVIVVDKNNKPIGLISDSDVVARIQPTQRRKLIDALRGRADTPADKITAQALMSPGVLTAQSDTPLVEAIQRMMAQRRKWLVVVNEEGTALGLVDRHILIRALTSG
ncbi:MAG: DUF190 domain-containing protein [Chloroflexota bacterium]